MRLGPLWPSNRESFETTTSGHLSLPQLTIDTLCSEAQLFAEMESAFPEPSLYGATDGKAVGTYLEHKFRGYLASRYDFSTGNSASGIDFPSLEVDMKVTSVAQPQSSCPFKSARQKIFGLGYHLIVFVYTKTDVDATRTATLRIDHTIFVDRRRTGDYQMTRGLRQILDSQGNEDDLVAFMFDKMLPVDSIEAKNIAAELLSGVPLEQGYLTISNALQWRLQYTRILSHAGTVDGIRRVR
jgi:hypothetical protein